MFKMGVQISYVEPVLLFYWMGFYLTMLTGPQFLLRKVCLTYFNSTYCDNGIKNQTNEKNENMVQATASEWSASIQVCCLLPALIFTFIYGFLSDIVGRKKILVVPIVGDAISNVFYLVSAWYLDSSLWYLMGANLISGVCGTYATVLMCVTAYISDTSEKEARTKRIMMMGIIQAITMVFGSICGGLIIENFGYVAAYSIIMVFYCLSLIYLFFLKESLENLEGPKIENAELIKNMKEIFGIIFKKRNKDGRKMIHLLLTCMFFKIFVSVGFNTISTFFLKHSPLNFDAKWLGYFSAEQRAIQFISGILVIWILIEKFEWRDSSILILSSIPIIAFMVCLSFSSNHWQVFVSGLCFLGIGAGTLAAQSSLTKMVHQDELGKMCSFTANLELLCTLIGSAVFPIIYGQTVGINPGFGLLTIAIIGIIPLIVAAVIHAYEKRVPGYAPLNSDENGLT